MKEERGGTFEVVRVAVGAHLRRAAVERAPLEVPVHVARDEEVEAAVVVVVEECGTAAHRLRQILLRGGRGRVAEVDAAPRGDVREVDGRLRLRRRTSGLARGRAGLVGAARLRRGRLLSAGV